MSVLLLSGGVDSSALLAWFVGTRNATPLCLSFDYGQRHARELDAARVVAAHFGVPWRLLRLSPETLAGSALTGGGPVPQGHYADPIQSATVVPNRNAVFLSLAAAQAVRLGREEVLFAAHAGDAAIYPDCRPEFVAAIGRALFLACGVRVVAPFLDLTKRGVVRQGRTHACPFHLTWTCYEGGAEPCGACGACVERNEAFAGEHE